MSQEDLEFVIYRPLDWQARLGMKIDRKRCRWAVTHTGEYLSSQCQYLAKLEVGGLGFCTRHAKEAAERLAWA